MMLWFEKRKIIIELTTQVVRCMVRDLCTRVRFSFRALGVSVQTHSQMLLLLWNDADNIRIIEEVMRNNDEVVIVAIGYINSMRCQGNLWTFLLVSASLVKQGCLLIIRDASRRRRLLGS